MSTISSLTTNSQSSVLGTTFLDGLASGLDTTEIIEQLAAVKSAPINRLKTQKETINQKLAIYQSINIKLASLRLAANDLADTTNFVSGIASVKTSNGSAAPIIVSAGNSVITDSYQVKVEQLASAHKISGGGMSSSANALELSGELLINGKSIQVSAEDSLTDIRDALNNANVGVSASILQVSSTDHRLILTSRETGADNAINLIDVSGDVLQSLGLNTSTETKKHALSATATQSDTFTNSAQDITQALGLSSSPAGRILIQGVAIDINLGSDSLSDINQRINNNIELQAAGITAEIVPQTKAGVTTGYRLQINSTSGALTLADDLTADSNILHSLGFLTKNIADEKQAAQDSRTYIDGTLIQRSSNSLDDVISGLSIELVATNIDKPATLTTRPDFADVSSRVQSFVDAYNAIISIISENQSFDSDTKEGGLLFGDTTAMGLERGLRNAVMQAVIGINGTSNTLSSIGITTDQNDQLVLNASKLKKSLEENPNTVAKLLGSYTETSSSAIEYISSDINTGDTGKTGFAINVTQIATRATATSASLTSGLTQDEILTFNGNHPVTLTAGMSLSETTDTLNGWFKTWNLSYEAKVDGDKLTISHEQFGSHYSVQVRSSLAKGVGGTDLGGDNAGANAIYSGKNVVGTINGEAATGSGQFLTGLKGNSTTSGLKLRIFATTTGLIGNVKIYEGAAKRLSDQVGLDIANETGSISRSMQSLSAQVTLIDEEISAVNARVQTYSDTMRTKYIALETKLARAQTLQQYITSQLKSYQTSND